MIFYCVRHGESVSNAEGRIQGQSDVPLSDLGRRQSEAAAEVLAARPITAIFASPLRRAMETAEPIARQLGLPIQTDPRLMEIHAGVFQGRLGSELHDLYPEAIARWSSGDPDFVIPGGESRRQLARRSCEAFEAIHQSGHEQVAVVCHGGVIVTAIKTLLRIPLAEPPLAVENASITILSWDSAGRVELVALDQTDHLRNVGQGTRGDLAV